MIRPHQSFHWRFNEERWELTTGGVVLAYVDSIVNIDGNASERMRYPVLWRAWDSAGGRVSADKKLWTLDAARDTVNRMFDLLPEKRSPLAPVSKKVPARNKTAGIRS